MYQFLLTLHAMKKIIPFVIVCLLMIACGQTENEKQVRTKAEKARLDSIDKASLKVGVMPTLDCLPVYLAKESHIFEDLGVEVHLKYFTAHMDCDTALIGESVEGSISDLVRAEKLQEKGVALDYPISTNTYWQLITGKRARINELSQLSDKMIAMTRYSATDKLSDIAIAKGKPKYDVYRVQINDVKVRLMMMLNHEMDAAWMTEPQASEAIANGHKKLMDSRDEDVQWGVFAFRKASMNSANRKKQLALFIKAYDRAVDSINQKGVQHYGKLIAKYCGTHDKGIKALPKIHFQHAGKPNSIDINKVK